MAFTLNQMTNLAQTCSAYLNQTNVGAIKVEMRQYTIWTLNSLSATVQNQAWTIGNLQQQVASLQNQVAQLNHIIVVRNQTIVARDETIRELRTDLDANLNTSEAAAATAAQRQFEMDSQAAKEFDAKQNELEVARLAQAELFETEMATIKAVYETKLEAALSEASNAKKSKRNANRTMAQLLEFCLANDLGVQGFMMKHYKIYHFDMNIIAELLEALKNNQDMDFEDDSLMIHLVDYLERQCSLGDALPAAQPPAHEAAPAIAHAVVEEEREK